MPEYHRPNGHDPIYQEISGLIDRIGLDRLLSDTVVHMLNSKQMGDLYLDQVVKDLNMAIQNYRSRNKS